jgi:hypothetical protein
MRLIQHGIKVCFLSRGIQLLAEKKVHTNSMEKQHLILFD